LKKNMARLLMTLLIIAMIASIPVFGQDYRYRVAVLPFDDSSIQNRWWSNSWNVGAGVADELVTELLKTNKFRLIEREQLNKILGEQDLGAQGRIDPGTAAKIGKILGVQFLIMGKVTEFATGSKGGGALSLKGGFAIAIKSNVAKVAIDARLVDATSAEIITSVTGRGEKKQTNVGLIANWNAISLGSDEFKQTNLGLALRDAVASVANQISEKAYNAGLTQSATLPAPPIAAPQTDNRPRIAVMPFDDGSVKNRWWSNSWEVGSGVADELVTGLIKTEKFRLIEREQLDNILREQNLGVAGRIDPNTAARIGKILGAQYLVMGKVTEFTTDSKNGGAASGPGGFGLSVSSNYARVAIDARLVDASTAEIISAVTGRGEQKQTNVGIAVNWNAIAFGSDEFKQTKLGLALRDAVDSVSGQLAEKIPAKSGNSQFSRISGTVADIYKDKVYLTIGSNDGVQSGMVFIVEHPVKTVKNPKTGEVIDQITEPIAEITVTSVKSSSAVCTVTKKLNSKYAIASNDSVILKN